MKQFIIILLVISGFQWSNAQRMRSGMPQQTELTPEQLEKRKKEAERKRNQMIDEFVATLEGDAFQKQIIRQYIDTYIEEKLVLINTEYKIQKERVDAFKKLDETHFLELKELISENDYQQIQDFISGKYNDKESKKEKKKKKKKKNKD